MGTIIATALASGGAHQVSTRLAQSLREQLGGVEPVLVVVFGSTEQPLGELMHGLTAAFPGATAIGASTAGEFTEAGDAKRAAAAFAVAGDLRASAALAADLRANVDGAVAGAVRGLAAADPRYPHRTGILLLDPLAGNGEEATLIASSLLGDIPLAGGAAGDDLHMKRTEVACGARAATDAVVVAVIESKEPLGIGVSHGHVPLSRPLKVTRAEANVVREIEGRPAWTVWQEQTRESAGRRGVDPAALAEDEIGGYLLRYEAGLAAGGSYKIRAPLGRDAAGAISFACGIPDGAVIQITESVPERQIESARRAAKLARAALGGADVAGALVFDCICRNLILGGEFQTAVKGISQELGGAKLAGFETYGEIALQVGDMSGFHNTTTVVLAFPR